MTDYIRIQVGEYEYKIPNRWELITKHYQYIMLVKDLMDMSQGRMSPGMVRINYICRFFDWDLKKIKGSDTFSTLVALSEKITFIFRISYPDEDEALKGLDTYTYQLCKCIPPHRLNGVTIARALQKLDYKFTINLMFCRQFIPYVTVNDEHYSGYTIEQSFGTMTTSLTVLQFIEARQLIGKGDDVLPLMAAILYHPGHYNSESAHRLAQDFAMLPKEELYGISLNFQAFCNFLFSATHYKLLTMGKESKSVISTGALESLYNLSSDGYGDVNCVERMNLLQYLTILRKKTIESVRSLHSSKMELVDIAKETGLPISIIKQIIL